MDKKKLISFIIKQLEKDLQLLIDAAQATYEAATHEESKPENEYDTRGLEASYLAGAQAKRVAEIEEILYIFKHTELKSFSSSDVIAPSALIEVLLDGQKKIYVLLMPKGGGQTLKFEEQIVQVITPSSPLGEALIGLRVNDIATVEMGTQTKEYEVLAIQ